MPGELNKVRDQSYSKGKEKGFWNMFIPKKSWTQKRAHTTIIPLKIRVNHGILILIEVHPLEKTHLIPRKMELKNLEKTIALERENIILDFSTSEKGLDTIENPHNNHTIADRGCSWITALKNCLGAMFQSGFNRAPFTFGNYTLRGS